MIAPEITMHTDPQINLEAIVALAVSFVGVLAWLFRMEAVGRANKEKALENIRVIEKVDLRIEKLENRHDQVSNEMRSMLYGISGSIKNIEGRLSINSKGEG